MERKLNTTCRICLCFGSRIESNSKSLFEIHNNSVILDSIILIANVKIQADNGLPSKICGDCLTELDTAISFKDKCERSNNLLLLIRDDVDEVKLNTSPIAEIPIPIDLVKKEDESDNDIQYKVEYYDDADTAGIDSPIKQELDQTHTDVSTEMKLELKAEKSGALESCEPHPVPKKSKAIDLMLKCDDCGGSFKSKCKLRVHWKKVHATEKMICNFCKRTFKSFKPYHKHLNNRPLCCIIACETRIEGIGKSRVFNCKNCHYSTKKSRALQLHLAAHKEERPFVCDICSKSFKVKTILRCHKESVHKIIDRVITCQYCGEVVEGRDKIHRHMQRHTQKPVQCDICKKIFKSKNTLRNHLKYHGDVKSFRCDQCEASYYTHSALLIHKYKHINRKFTYICDICGYKPSKEALLKKHKLQHLDCNVSCGVCGRFYPNEEELSSHQKVHTKEKSECLQCNRIFCDERSLKRHLTSAAHRNMQSSFVEKDIKTSKIKVPDFLLYSGKNRKVKVKQKSILESQV